MTTADRTCDWLSRFIEEPSVSHVANAGIAEAIAEVAESIGFDVELSTYADAAGVTKTNLAAVRRRSSNGISRDVAYFGHSDVVPVTSWTGPGEAFRPKTVEGRLFGRGACDMKGSVATFLAAAARTEDDSRSGTVWFFITADEEVGFGGAQQLVATNPLYREVAEKQPIAVIGEPTRLRPHHAHKGITGFRLTSHGRAAHSSGSDGINANLAMMPLLRRMTEIEQRTRESKSYQDPNFDPPTLSWNFGVSDHMTAINITPPRCDAWCSLRTMPGIDGEDLIEEIRVLAQQSGVEFSRLEGCSPMVCDPHSPVHRHVIKLTGHPCTAVCYGTDGGVLSGLDYRVILGPGDIRQAHTSDEFIELSQIDAGIGLYERLLIERPPMKSSG